MSISASGSGSAFKAASAWMPIALAVTAMTVLVGYLLTGPHAPTILIEHGVARADEGPAARLWQLLMLAQLPLILFFSATWLPRDTRRALLMLALQVSAFVAAALPVFLLEM